MFEDLRFAVRLLFRQPLFTVTALLALALGLGSSTAIFSIVKSVLLSPLPYSDPDKLYSVWGRQPPPRSQQASVSPGDFEDFAAQTSSFSQLCALRNYSTTWTGNGEPLRVFSTLVTVNYFEMMGIPAGLGRTFLPEEGKFGAHHSAVLTAGFWKRHFGGDPAAVGKIMHLGGEPFVIVGVLKEIPGDYRASEIYLPLAFEPEEIATRSARFLSVVVRLKPGVSVEQAQSDLTTVAARLGQSYADTNRGWTVFLRPLSEDVTGDSRQSLIVLSSAVTLVLLITCANLASLLLVRAAGRRKEIAIRASLGAAQSRVVRQLITESAILGIVGGLAGIPVAYAVLRAIQQFGPAGMPRLDQASLDAPVLGFAFLLSLCTGILFGLAPAWQTLRVNLSTTLREESRGTSGGMARSRGRAILVIVEVALSGILLVCAGLLIRTFLNLNSIDPGFRPDHVLTMRTTLPDSKYPTHEATVNYVHEVLRRIESVPGVTSAGITTALPMMNVNWTAEFQVEGLPEPAPGQREIATYNTVTPRYFETLGIRLLRGRGFTEADSGTSLPVVIISEAFARQYFPNEDPVGRFLTTKVSRFTARQQIVGVVADVRHMKLDEPPRVALYQPHSQLPWPFLAFAVRTAGDPAGMAPTIRRAILEVDSAQPVDRVQPLTRLLDLSFSQQRLAMVLLIAFAVLALLLAALGLYGVLAYSVAQRGREIGIRMALGAQRGQIVQMVFRQGLLLTMAGLAAGLIAAPIAAQALRDLLSGVSPFDTLTFAAVAALLFLLALAACWIPARRAVRVDPGSALRCD